MALACATKPRRKYPRSTPGLDFSNFREARFRQSSICSTSSILTKGTDNYDHENVACHSLGKEPAGSARVLSGQAGLRSRYGRHDRRRLSLVDDENKRPAGL